MDRGLRARDGADPAPAGAGVAPRDARCARPWSDSGRRVSRVGRHSRSDPKDHATGLRVATDDRDGLDRIDKIGDSNTLRLCPRHLGREERLGAGCEAEPQLAMRGGHGGGELLELDDDIADRVRARSRRSRSARRAAHLPRPCGQRPDRARTPRLPPPRAAGRCAAPACRSGAAVRPRRTLSSGAKGSAALGPSIQAGTQTRQRATDSGKAPARTSSRPPRPPRPGRRAGQPLRSAARATALTAEKWRLLRASIAGLCVATQTLALASAGIGRLPITFHRLLHVADLVRIVGAEHDVVGAGEAIANCRALGSKFTVSNQQLRLK